jgi:hypothetical protein
MAALRPLMRNGWGRDASNTHECRQTTALRHDQRQHLCLCGDNQAAMNGTVKVVCPCDHSRGNEDLAEFGSMEAVRARS